MRATRPVAIADVRHARRRPSTSSSPRVDPVVKIARWAALSAGSDALSTPDRLDDAAAAERARRRRRLESCATVSHGWCGSAGGSAQPRLRSTADPVDDVVSLSEMAPQERATLRSVAREVAGISRKLTYLASTSAFQLIGTWIDRAPRGRADRRRPRLEGWQPTDEHVAALARAGARGRVLRRLSRRHSAPGIHRRSAVADARALRRAVPYLIPGTTLLRNNFGALIARDARRPRIRRHRRGGWFAVVRADGGAAGLDVRALHRHLFADVYSWAGEYRIDRTTSRPASFAWQSRYRRDGGCSTGSSIGGGAGATHDGPRLAYELARLYADFNQIHPFREGNGRTGALLLHAVAARCGRTTRSRRDHSRRVVRGRGRQHAVPTRRSGQPSTVPVSPAREDRAHNLAHNRAKPHSLLLRRSLNDRECGLASS